MKQVYKNLNDEDEKGDNILFILDDENFEETNLCECYNNDGIIIDCYDAGCYCWDNNSDFRRDFYNSIKDERIKEIKEDFFDCATIEEVYSLLEENNISYEKIDEEHTRARAYTFWDGHNFKTLVLACDIEDAKNVEEVEESEKIIELYRRCDFPDYVSGISTVNTMLYRFQKSLFSDDPYFCTVEKRDPCFVEKEGYITDDINLPREFENFDSEGNEILGILDDNGGEPDGNAYIVSKEEFGLLKGLEDKFSPCKYREYKIEEEDIEDIEDEDFIKDTKWICNVNRGILRVQYEISL